MEITRETLEKEVTIFNIPIWELYEWLSKKVSKNETINNFKIVGANCSNSSITCTYDVLFYGNPSFTSKNTIGPKNLFYMLESFIKSEIGTSIVFHYDAFNHVMTISEDKNSILLTLESEFEPKSSRLSPCGNKTLL